MLMAVLKDSFNILKGDGFIYAMHGILTVVFFKIVTDLSGIEAQIFGHLIKNIFKGTTNNSIFSIPATRWPL
jgi:hypothetical protein